MSRVSWAAGHDSFATQTELGSPQPFSGLVDSVFSVCAHVSGASLMGHLSYETDSTPLITVLEIVAPPTSHSGLMGGRGVEQTPFGCQPHPVVQSIAL